MSDRILKLNKHIQRVFGEVLQEEADVPADVLVTISKVDVRPNLRSATVWLYVYPSDKGEATVDHLQEQIYDLQGALNRELQLRPLPRIILRLDHGIEHAQHIEEKLASIKKEPAQPPTDAV